MQKKISVLTALGLSACLLLSSCGFQLRGSFNLPSQFNALKLEAVDIQSPLIRLLRENLISAGTRIDDKAEYTLYIGAEEQLKERITVSESALFDEYELINNVSFEIRDRNGKPLTQSRTVTSQDTFIDNQSSPNVKAVEERLLREELQEDLSRQIMRQLQVFDTELLAPPPDPDKETQD